jgi:hypothetical protein
MTQYVINIGTIPNDGTGDPLRTAFNEVNLNFDQVFAAGPVLSNIRIANNTILTTNTNGNIVLAPNGIGVVQSNVSILPNTANIRNLGSANQRWNTVYTQYLDVSANLTISGNIIYNGDLNVAGNLTVNGDLIEVGNIVTDSKTIQLANTAGTTAAANGSGITVGANDLIATYLFNSTANAWTTNIGISAVGNIAAPYFLGNGSQLIGVRADTLVGNTLSSNVLFSSLTSVGTLTNLNVTGNVSAAGNVIGANLETGGLISATGNVTGGNLGSAGQIIATGNVTGGNLITSGLASITGNITAGNVGITGSSLTWANASIIQTSTTDVSITGDGQVTIRSLDGTYQWTFDDAGNLTAPGNIGTSANVAANYFIGDGSQLTGIGASYTNADVANLLAAFGSNVINSTGNITTTANISGAYILGDGSQLTNLPVQPGTYSNANVVSLLSAFGSNTISTTGNITAGYILGNGSALTSITGANVTGTVANAAYATTAGSATTATTATTANTVTNAAQSNITSVGTLTSLTSSGNIQGGNLLTGGSISATGNVTANYFFGNTIGLTGNITNLDSVNFTVENISALVGNNGVNIGAGGYNNLVVLPDEVLIQNVPLNTAGNISANYFIGNGSQLTGIVSNYGDSNVTTLLSNFGSNTVSTTGNVTSGNLVTSGIVSATGNISTTGNVNSANVNTSRMVIGNIGGSSISADGRIFTSGNIVAGNINSNGVLFATGNIVGPHVNVTGNVVAGNVNTTNLLFSAGNIVGANVETGGLISATGNITANYFIGNGSQLTGIVVSGGTSIDNGTSNVTVPVANGNVNINANGTYAWTFGTDGRLTFPGTLSAPNDTDINIQALNNDGDPSSTISMRPNDPLMRLEQWSSQDSVSFSTADWATGTYTIGGGQGAVQFTGAANLINSLNALQSTGQIYFSVNGGPKLLLDGTSAGATNITFYTPTLPATDPTTVTTFDYYYSYNSLIEIDYDSAEFNIESNNVDLTISTVNQRDIELNSSRDMTLIGNGTYSLTNYSNTDGIFVTTDANNGIYQWEFGTDGNLTLPGSINSTSTIIIDNRASGNSADINLYAADDILIQARDRTLGSTSEGGDINIFAGDSAEDSDSSGGDVQISAGDGGAANVDFGGSGGFITIRSGQGGAAIGNSGYSAEFGGALTLGAGDAGSNNGNIDLGAAGGDVYIGAGDSTGNTADGGGIYITSGAAGTNALAGQIQLTIPPSDSGSGGVWIFDGYGNLTAPGNVTAAGNISGGNILTAGVVSATGNVSGNYFIGNGSQLTGISSGVQSSIANGTSNVNIATANGNVTITANAETYTFGTNSTLTLPGGSQLRPIGANLDIFAGTGAYVNLTTSDESSRIGVDNAGGYIATAGGTWDFGTRVI